MHEAQEWIVSYSTRWKCITNSAITLFLFPTFSRHKNEFLSLSRVRHGSARYIHLNNRLSQTSWETYYATVCLHWKSTIRTTTKCFSTSAENAKRDSFAVPAAQRSVGLWGEIAEETAGCGWSSMVYDVMAIGVFPNKIQTVFMFAQLYLPNFIWLNRILWIWRYMNCIWSMMI